MFHFFQAAGFGSYYLNDFSRRYPNVGSSFHERRQALLDDRYGASHILKPVYNQCPNTFFTVCDDPVLQTSWAREHGLQSNNLSDILLAQLEEHSTEVFYNLHPLGFPSSFIRRLPSTIKKKIAWRAAPSGVIDLSAYNAVVSNFELLNANWQSKGWRAMRFFPSWDPETLLYGRNIDRLTDIFFAGSYARTTGHDGRLSFLNKVAELSVNYEVDLRLLYRKWGRLGDYPPWCWVPMPVRLPEKLKTIVGPPVFGHEMYRALSEAKIVINPATDIAGTERGNMRCWEALGCGVCMLGSAGQYPEGFEAGVNFEMFTDTSDLIQKIHHLLNDEERRTTIATAGVEMMKRLWSKERQWIDFEVLVAKL